MFRVAARVTVLGHPFLFEFVYQNLPFSELQRLPAVEIGNLRRKTNSYLACTVWVTASCWLRTASCALLMSLRAARRLKIGLSSGTPAYSRLLWRICVPDGHRVFRAFGPQPLRGGGSRFPGRMTDRAGRAAAVGGEKEVIAEYLPIGKKARPVFSGTGPGFML